METKRDTLFVQVDDCFEAAFEKYSAFLGSFYSALPCDVEDEDEKGTTCCE